MNLAGILITFQKPCIQNIVERWEENQTAGLSFERGSRVPIGAGSVTLGYDRPGERIFQTIVALSNVNVVGYDG